MNCRAVFLSTVSVVALLSAVPALGADIYALSDPSRMPAVSAPNGKLGAFAGAIGGDFGAGVTGSLAVPLHDQWGAQIDGMAGAADSAGLWGVGGHLFWRDPSKGLVGLTGSWVSWGKSETEILPLGEFDDTNQLRDITGADVGTVGVEAEAYLGRVSLEGAAGVQFGDNSGFQGRATLAYYATDDLRLSIGASVLAGRGAALRAGAEWAPAGETFSLFANAAAASSDNWSATGGVKFYFGAPQKSLIDRHRQDDPENMLPDDLYSIVGDNYCPVDHVMLDGFCDSNS